MATEQQIPVIAARLVEYQKEFSKLPSEDAQWLINHSKEAIDICVKAIVNRPQAIARSKTTVLGPIISTFTVPASAGKFVARDKFIIDKRKNAKVKISHLSENFTAQFLDKIEDPFAGSVVSGRKLKKISIDSLILLELGGNEKAEATLTEIYAMMESQPNGEDGCLINDGSANIYYVLDVNGILRAVVVRWYDGGWGVDAGSVEDPDRWSAGGRVFSRNSLAPQAV